MGEEEGDGRMEEDKGVPGREREGGKREGGFHGQQEGR